MQIEFKNYNELLILEEIDNLNHLKEVILKDVDFDRIEVIADINYQIAECKKALEVEEAFIHSLEEENILKRKIK